MIQASNKTGKEYFLSAFNVLDSVLWVRGTGMNPHHCSVDAPILVRNPGREFMAEGTTLAKAVPQSSHTCVQGTSKTEPHPREVGLSSSNREPRDTVCGVL